MARSHERNEAMKQVTGMEVHQWVVRLSIRNRMRGLRSPEGVLNGAAAPHCQREQQLRDQDVHLIRTPPELLPLVV